VDDDDDNDNDNDNNNTNNNNNNTHGAQAYIKYAVPYEEMIPLP
jgi:hypothetical protein